MEVPEQIKKHPILFAVVIVVFIGIIVGITVIGVNSLIGTPTGDDPNQSTQNVSSGGEEPGGSELDSGGGGSSDQESGGGGSSDQDSGGSGILGKLGFKDRLTGNCIIGSCKSVQPHDDSVGQNIDDIITDDRHDYADEDALVLQDTGELAFPPNAKEKRSKTKTKNIKDEGRLIKDKYDVLVTFEITDFGNAEMEDSEHTFTFKLKDGKSLLRTLYAKNVKQKSPPIFTASATEPVDFGSSGTSDKHFKLDIITPETNNKKKVKMQNIKIHLIKA